MFIHEAGEHYTVSQQHSDAKSTHHTHDHSEQTPLEVALQNMEQGELEQMRILFNTAYYLVQAECPFHDFPAILALQRLNGVPLGHVYNTHMQAKML